MQNYNNYPYIYNPNFNNQNYNQQTTNQYAFVNGVEGAKAYQVMPNQKMMLMDSDNPIVFMKTSDNYGKASLRYFKLVEVSEEELKVKQFDTNSPYALKADLDDLKEKLNTLSAKLEKPLETAIKEE